jgi:CelD/BcsL family acetyltransferase involved in cellulose biosynthesis
VRAPRRLWRRSKEGSPFRLSPLIVALDDPAWGRFLDASPDALPFHHCAWASVVADCYGFHGFALVLVNERGEIVAGLPVVEISGPLSRRRWISLPFSDRCPPLLRTPALASPLADALERARSEHEVVSVEVRGPLGEPRLALSLDALAVMHTRPLAQDPALVFRTLREQARRNVRVAERRGAKVRRTESRKELTETFYALQVHTRKRHGLPVQPRRMFELLWDRMLEHDLGFLLLAHVGRTPVAGAVFLAWNRTVTFKYGASLPEYWTYRPNDLLFWTAIKWGCANGFQTFDFGRTDAPNSGLRRFKNGWGVEEPLIYSALGKPQRAARPHRVTSALIRHAPPWLVRLSGELLYRYAA